MRTHEDFFRPKHDPARLLYDAFQKEAKKRSKREWPDWHKRELKAVYNAACRYARRHNLNEPTFEQVEQADESATGSVDYGAKWAYRVVDFMIKEY